jgi:hypothetical protein
MKKFLTIIAATMSLWTSASFAQTTTTMTSVMGIELGSSKAKVSEILTSKQPECKVFSQTEKSISYTDVKWGDYKAYLVIFQFSPEDKLHTVQILIQPEFPKGVFNLYDEIIEKLAERYGNSKKKLEYYSHPYNKTDKYKYTESMVKNGNVTMISLWTFDVLNTASNEDDDNTIQVKVVPECMVKVSYQDAVIINEVVRKQKENNSKDY